MVDSKEMLKHNKFQPPEKKQRFHKKDAMQCKIVYSYAAYGATNEDIAIALGINIKTLEKHFKQELKEGRATAKSTIAQRIYQVAVGKEEVIDKETNEVLMPAVKPNLTALIFLAKTRLGWKETQIVETKQEVIQKAILELPDNGRRTVSKEFME